MDFFNISPFSWLFSGGRAALLAAVRSGGGSTGYLELLWCYG